MHLDALEKIEKEFSHEFIGFNAKTRFENLKNRKEKVQKEVTKALIRDGGGEISDLSILEADVSDVTVSEENLSEHASDLKSEN